MMQQLPYELLQQISTSLLPRYQCRLALASKWCYRYLYTPLLKWHALKQHIKPPTHKIYRSYSKRLHSLTIYDNKVWIMSIIASHFYIDDLTTLMVHNISMSGKLIHTFEISFHAFYCDAKLYNRVLKTAQCHKYVHRECLLAVLNSKQSIMFLRDSDRIRICIFRMLNDKDIEAIYQCKHLSFIFAP